MSRLQKLTTLVVLGILMAIAVISSCSVANSDRIPYKGAKTDGIQTKEGLFVIHFNDGTVLVKNIKYDFYEEYIYYSINSLIVQINKGRGVKFNWIKFYEVYPKPYPHIEEGVHTVDYFTTVLQPSIDNYFADN